MALQVDNSYDGDHFENKQPPVPVAKFDEHDTQGILALCEEARRTARPERDIVISQIFALNLDRCRPEALEVVELLIYDLIVNEIEQARDKAGC